MSLGGLGLERGANNGLDSRHFSHDIRSNEFRFQFTCRQLERDVLGRQPNILTAYVKWGLIK